MMKERGLGFFGAVLICIMAWETASATRAEFIPVIKFSGQYDDNVFLEPSGEKTDFVTRFSPGLNIRVPFGEYIADFRYTADILSFSQYPSQDTLNHILYGQMKLDFNGWGINLEDNFEDTSERADTELTPRIDRQRNRLNLTSDIKFNRMVLELILKSQGENYEEKSWEHEDRVENIYGLLFGIKVLPKTSVIGEYNYGEINYSRGKGINSGSDFSQGFLGLRGELGAKCVANIKLGYQDRKYRKEGIPRFQNMVITTALTERFSQRDTAKITLLRTAHESAYSDYYRIDKVWAEWSHRFGPKTSWTINGSYQVNSYPQKTREAGEEKKRKDILSNLGFELRYRIQKEFSTSLGYEYRQRDSNFTAFDYTGNLITLSFIFTL